MSQTWKRVYGLSVLSYALSSLTIFTILCGLLPSGTLYVPAYLFTGLVFAAISYWAAPKWGLPLAGAALAIGIGSLYLINFEQVWTLFYPAIMFGGLAFLQWRRNIGLAAELQYARRILQETYMTDVKIVIALAVLTAFIDSDPSWQMKVLPFFTAFIITRVYAMSLATKATKEREGQEAFSEMVQNKLPFLITGAALFICWVLMSTGGAIVRLLLTMFEPVFLTVGIVVQFLMETTFLPQWLKDFLSMIAQWINDLICWLGFCPESTGGEPPEGELLELGAMEPGNWQRVFLMLAVFAVILIAMFVYYRMQNPGRVLPSDGAMEVREFIRAPGKQGKGRPRYSGGPLTRMRKTYRKFLLGMHKRDLVRREGETASELVERIVAQSPERRAELEELTCYYMEERYGGKRVEEKEKRAEELTRKLME